MFLFDQSMLEFHGGEAIKSCTMLNCIEKSSGTLTFSINHFLMKCR